MYIETRNNFSPEENTMIRDWLVPVHDMLDSERREYLAKLDIDHERCMKMAREGAHNQNMLLSDRDVDKFCIYISVIWAELAKQTHPAYWDRLGPAFAHEKEGLIRAKELIIENLKTLVRSLYKREEKSNRHLHSVS